MPLYALHTAPYYNFIIDDSVTLNGELSQNILLDTGLLSPLLITICIPLYLCLLRPFISQYVPGMLKRMGLGIILVVLSLVVTLVMDIVDHSTSDPEATTCMFMYYVDPIDFELNLYEESTSSDSSLLIVQLTLSAFSHMLIYTGVLEFLCSQSPHSMKGLLIGLLYAIKGLYQVLASLLVVPFAVGYLHHSSDHFSCGFSYYLVNIVVGLIAVGSIRVCCYEVQIQGERDYVLDLYLVDSLQVIERTLVCR